MAAHYALAQTSDTTANSRVVRRPVLALIIATIVETTVSRSHILSSQKGYSTVEYYKNFSV